MKTHVFSTLFLSASTALAQFVTVLNEGTPSGEIKNVNGVNIYHASPATKDTDAAILYLTDNFGMQFLQNKLLADSLAKAGYLVLVPDLFKGEPVPSDVKDFNRTTWRTRHPQAEVTGIIESTVAYARNTLGVKKLGATGYCFGGPYVIRQLAKNVDVGFIAHPGHFSNDELNAINGPLAIAAAETDNSLNATRRAEVEDLLAKAKKTYQVNLYAGTQHGFGVRIDLNDRKQVFAKQAAALQAIVWFNEWLKGGQKAGAKYLVEEGEQKDLRVPHDFEYSS